MTEASVRQPQVEFDRDDVFDIVDVYMRNGCVLIRKCFDPDLLSGLKNALDQVYAEVDGPHVHPWHFRERGLPGFHDRIFTSKHHELVDAIFAGLGSFVNESTGSRRVDMTTQDSRWQAPLATHIDALFHGFNFQANFWTPLHDCGEDLPRLFVVPATFSEIIDYSGYDGGPDGAWPAPLERFTPPIKDLYLKNEPDEEYLVTFAPRIWAPAYALGDVMLSSNWTLHGTYAAPGIMGRRESVELRFSSKVSVPVLIKAQVEKGHSLYV